MGGLASGLSTLTSVLPIVDQGIELVSGDIRVHALGWANDATAPLWSIEQSAPLAFTLLAVTTELKVND